MRVVAVLPDMRDRLAFARVAGQLGWTFTTVVSSAAVAGALRPGIPHLVICDRDLSGETWQEALPRLAAMPHVVRVLLASTVVDEYLWDEVIKHRGFDVVVKPYDAERLRRVAAFARSSMRWQ
jgi:DNA-binding NtrC family response regulator